MTYDDIERLARIAGAKADLTDEGGSNVSWVFNEGPVHNLAGMAAFFNEALEVAAALCSERAVARRKFMGAELDLPAFELDAAASAIRALKVAL